MTTFQARTITAFADAARQERVGDRVKYRHRAQSLDLVRSQVPDITPEASKLIKEAAEHLPGFHSHWCMLRAYWESYGIPDVAEARSRLWVNLPYAVKAGLGQNFVCGMAPHPQFSKFQFSKLEAAQVTGINRGYFDDISIFWSNSFDFEQALDLILPGSTLTFFKPPVKTEGYWMSWVGLDLGFEAIMAAAEKRYKLNSIAMTPLQWVLGVEAK